jgi:hypothetical protein
MIRLKVYDQCRGKLNRNQWPRQESNLDLELRKLLYYPLYYEALFNQTGNIATKYFNRNGQQYYTKKFTYCNHSAGT